MDTEPNQFTYRYFENRDCEFYPCHKGMDELNCLFCFCPFYTYEKCPGNPSYIEKDGGSRIKNCTGCTFPHAKDNYDKIMQLLKEMNK
jgi:Zn-finger protein